MVSKKIIVIAVVVIAVVSVVGVFVWQSMSASFADVEVAIKSFLSALNSYDVDASWASMSPELQLSYNSKGDFNSSILDGYKQAGWQATMAGASSKSVEIVNGVSTARFIVTLHITETGVSAYDDTYTFKLIKIGDQWKINDWLQGEWD